MASHEFSTQSMECNRHLTPFMLTDMVGCARKYRQGGRAPQSRHVYVQPLFNCRDGRCEKHNSES